ncbi:MAG: hypothetical protein ACI9VR_003466 [Cognaticolwellia sp.]|jgi:hypothetical protein
MMWMLASLACLESQNLEADFDAPAFATVLHPDQGGPFRDPVAFVSNQGRGTLVPLDIKHGWMISEDPSAPYLETPHIATGSDRVLGALAVYVPDDQTVTLFVADAQTRTLLEVPWVIEAQDERLTTVSPSVSSEPSFEDVDGSGDVATLQLVGLRKGRTATETWTFTYTGQDFMVEGSRSGLQYRRATWLAPYVTDEGELNLLIEGSATEGDRFTLGVESGVVEHDLGGNVQDLLMLPDQSAVLALVSTLEDPLFPELVSLTRMVALDPASMDVLAEISLPAGAWPARMSLSQDQTQIFLGDTRSPQVLQVTLDAEIGASVVESIAMPGNVIDVVQQGDEFSNRLYIALQGEVIVRLWDLDLQDWYDVNPVTAEIDGLYIGAPISGLAASSDPILLQEEGPYQARERDRVVAISSFEGVVKVAQATTGCLTQDAAGPSVTFGENASDVGFDDSSPTSTPSFTADVFGDAVQVNPCGGIARTQSWQMVYDGSQGNWQVEGSVSGFQERRVTEGVRYVSDRGEISFLISSGSRPTTDGDAWFFTVDNGVLKIDFDRNGNGVGDQAETPIDVPARPVSYSYLAGDQDAGWVGVNRKVGVILPVTGYDNVCKVDLQAGRITSIWD